MTFSEDRSATIWQIFRGSPSATQLSPANPLDYELIINHYVKPLNFGVVCCACNDKQLDQCYREHFYVKEPVVQVQRNSWEGGGLTMKIYLYFIIVLKSLFQNLQKAQLGFEGTCKDSINVGWVNNSISEWMNVSLHQSSLVEVV